MQINVNEPVNLYIYIYKNNKCQLQSHAGDHYNQILSVVCFKGDQ